MKEKPPTSEGSPEIRFDRNCLMPHYCVSHDPFNIPHPKEYSLNAALLRVYLCLADSTNKVVLLLTVCTSPLVAIKKTYQLGRIEKAGYVKETRVSTLLTIPDSRRIRSPDKKRPILFGLGTLLP